MGIERIEVVTQLWYTLGRWVIDGRKWFKGPIINLSDEERAHVHLDQDEPAVQANDIEKSEAAVADDDFKAADISEKENVATSQDGTVD